MKQTIFSSHLILQKTKPLIYQKDVYIFTPLQFKYLLLSNHKSTKKKFG